MSDSADPPPPSAETADTDDQIRLVEDDTVDQSQNEHQVVVGVACTSRSRIPVIDGLGAGVTFKPIKTEFVCYIGITFCIIMICAIFAVPMACLEEKTNKNFCTVDPFSAQVYGHSIFWFYLLLADSYLKVRHKKHRIMGFLQFYMKTRNIRRAPFYIVSFFNCALLVTVTLVSDYCSRHGGNCGDKDVKVDWLRGLITSECLAILFLFFFYVIKVRDFNRTKPLPDTMQRDFMRKLCVDLELDPTIDNDLETMRRLRDGQPNEDERNEMRPVVLSGPANQKELAQVMLLQAEVIRFLVKQLRYKNVKIQIIAEEGPEAIQNQALVDSCVDQEAMNNRTDPRRISL